MDRCGNFISGFFSTFLISLLFIFPKIVYPSDSLKIALVLEASNQEVLNFFSEQLIKALDQYSHLKFVHIDSNLSLSVKPLVIDSITVNYFKQRQMKGLVLGSISDADSVQTLHIKALKIDDFSSGIVMEIQLSEDSLSSKLNSIVQKIANYFQPFNKTENMVRILVVPMKIPETDTFFIIHRQALLDTLKKTFNSFTSPNIQLQFLQHDSVESSYQLWDWNDSSLIKIGKFNQADIVISGNIEQDEEQNILFHPYIVILQQTDTSNSSYADIKSLSGKTCQLNEFFLPQTSLNDINPIINFLSAYFLTQDKKYTEAIEKLKTEDSMAGNFYLAESYLNRGVSREQDKALKHVDLDSSIIYFKHCLLKSESLWDSVCVNNNLGVAYQMQGKLDSASVHFTEAKNRFPNFAPPLDLIRVSSNLGNIYLLRGQWRKALDIFQSNIEIMENSNDSLTLAATYENLGNIYQLIMQKDRAINYYTKALELRESLNDEAGVANSLRFLGDAYQEKNEFDTAKEYFRQGLTINQKLHNEPRIADSYDRLGQVFQNMGDLDSALVYYQKSIETFEMLNDKIRLVQTILHQASVYQKQKDLKKAISLYEKALEMTDNNDSKSLQAQIYDRMGDIYNNQDNLIPAYDFYKQSAELYEQIENYETLSLILYNMGLIRLKQNDYAEGYKLLKRAVTLDGEHGFHNLRSEKDFLRELESILEKN